MNAPSNPGKNPPQPPNGLESEGWHPELICARIILVAFLALSSAQVISRYAFGSPLIWTEELSTNLLIWMTFLGAAAIQRDDAHIRVELVEEFFGQKFALILFSIFDVFVILFLIALVIGGWQLMSQLEFEKTPALRIPIAWVVAIVPLMSIGMIVYSIANIARRLRRLTRNLDAD